MQIITDFKTINNGINGLSKRLKNLDSDTHTLAVSAIHHALEHSRNWELVTKLVCVVGAYDSVTNKFKSRAIRATDMRNWLVAHCPIKWEYKDGVGRYTTCAKKLAVFNAEACKEAILTPWYEKIKDEGAPVSFTPVDTRVANLIKGIQKDLKKYQGLGEQERAACEFNTKVSEELVQQLLQMVDFESLITSDTAAAA